MTTVNYIKDDHRGSHEMDYSKLHHVNSLVYGHYKYLNSYRAGIDFIRQNLTSTDGLLAETVKRLSYI